MPAKEMTRDAAFCQRLAKGRTLRVALRVDRFSRLLAQGLKAECHFQSQASGTRWTLIADAGAESDVVAFRLLRQGCRHGAHQFVKVRLTAVGCVSASGKKSCHFQGQTDREVCTMMRVKRDQVSGWTACLLPNDHVTLRCEITEYQEVEGTSDCGKAFVRRRAEGRATAEAGWRDSYILSVPATDMSLA